MLEDGETIKHGGILPSRKIPELADGLAEKSELSQNGYGVHDTGNTTRVAVLPIYSSRTSRSSSISSGETQLVLVRQK